MNYLVTSDLHVIDENGKDCGGPYKNRKSAVGRISDLKRKEISADIIKDGLKAGLRTTLIAPAAFKQDDMTDQTPLPKMTFAQVVGRYDRPRGVYPAVSKHSYQR